MESAVKDYTLNPAKSLGIDDMHGSITIGMYANLVILDLKYLSRVRNTADKYFT